MVDFSTIFTKDNIIFAIICIIIAVIILYKPTKNWIRRKRLKELHSIKQVPETEYPGYVPPAPELSLPGFESNFNVQNGAQNALEMMKNTLQNLDKELQQNSQNMQKVLQNVVTMETDLRNKMKEYWDIDQDLKQKEQLLRYQLEALRQAKISIPHPNACPVCGEEMTPVEGTDKLFCYNCYKNKKVK